nr:glycosyltransferase [Marinicella sp. W31]MDC2875964.1 glycosyltransferase [Marinicella sp. W31]
MTDKPKLIFIHGGEAMYPMNKSLMARLSDKIDFFDETFESAARRPDIGECICWHLMGLYREKLPCKFTIHDYRSMSIGRFRRVKDMAKRFLNARPDARVSKPEIEKVMRFNDDVETILIDISVSDYVIDFRQPPSTAPDYDYCYIGVISRERGIERIIRQFIESAGKDKTLLLVGRVQDGIQEEFAAAKNVTFTGPVEQKEVFRLLNRSGVALSYFPNHFPHTHQTPTKLLEYGALGMRILCNNQPMNRARAEDYGLEAVWRDDDRLFEDLPGLAQWPENYEKNPVPLLFSTHLENSGLKKLLERLTGLTL